MKLKKKNCISILLIICIFIMFLLVGEYLYYGIGGSVIVKNPDFVIKEYAECNYGVDYLLEEKVSCRKISDGIMFKSHSDTKGVYKYKFFIEGNGIEVCTEIRLYHYYFNHDRYNFDIELSPNGDGGYSAVVKGSGSGKSYYQCHDAEKEGISFQIGP